MLRPGADPENVQMSDVLCDFCGAAWTADLPLIEGHQGNVICGRCVSVAIVETGEWAEAGAGPIRCRMCLEQRNEPAWVSPMDESARICRRCIDMAADALEGDAETNWRRPG